MKIKDIIKEDAAGVGIITKQNTTADVNKGTLRKMLKAYKLTGTSTKSQKEDSVKESCKFGRYYCSTDKKWKCRIGPKQQRS